MLPSDLVLAVINADMIEAMKMNAISKVITEKGAGALKTKLTEKCREDN